MITALFMRPLSELTCEQIRLKWLYLVVVEKNGKGNLTLKIFPSFTKIKTWPFGNDTGL